MLNSINVKSYEKIKYHKIQHINNMQTGIH